MSEKFWSLELGANVSNGGVRFRIWAPKASSISLIVTGESEEILLDTEKNGYFITFRRLQGRNKQNLSSLIFQAGPMLRINEFTYN